MRKPASALAALSLCATAALGATVTARDRFYDASCARAGEVWAVGWPGRVLRVSRGGPAVETPLAADETFFGLQVRGAEAWAVGTRGSAFRSDDGGGAWRKVPVPTDESLFSVHFIDERTGFLVGDFGTALVTRDGGRSWRKLPLPFPSEARDPRLSDVDFADRRRGWIVGEFGLIFHTEDGGRSWTRQKNPAESALIKAAFNSAGAGYAAGMNGTLLRTLDGGRRWSRLKTPTSEHLLAIVLQGDGAWVGGADGSLLKVRAGKVSAAASGVQGWISALTACGDSAVLMAGQRGTLWASADGGRAWQSLIP